MKNNKLNFSPVGSKSVNKQAKQMLKLFALGAVIALCVAFALGFSTGGQGARADGAMVSGYSEVVSVNTAPAPDMSRYQRCRYSLFFHGIPVGDRTTIKDFYLELNIPRQPFWLVNPNTDTHEAPWSGSSGNRAIHTIDVEFAFPRVALEDGRFPIIRFELEINVPSGNQRFWNVLVPYYLQPQTVRIGLSNNFFVWVEHNNIPHSNFNNFQLNVAAHQSPFMRFTAMGNINTVRTFNATALLNSEDIYIGAIDRDSPFFDVEFGNNGQTLVRPPEYERATGETNNGLPRWAIWTIVGGAIGLFLLGFMYIRAKGKSKGG